MLLIKCFTAWSIRYIQRFCPIKITFLISILLYNIAFDICNFPERLCIYLVCQVFVYLKEIVIFNVENKYFIPSAYQVQILTIIQIFYIFPNRNDAILNVFHFHCLNKDILLYVINYMFLIICYLYVFILLFLCNYSYSLMVIFVVKYLVNSYSDENS